MNKRTSWMIWYAIILHVVWGISLVLSDKPTWITAINALTDYIPNNIVLGILMVLVGVMAGISLLERKASIKGIVLVLPQQFFLILSAFGAIEAVSNSAFADGVVRPRIFIFTDQFPAILAAIMHTIALIHHYGEGVWKQLF